MSGTSANRNGRASTRVPGRPPGLAYWLIAKSESCGMEIFTIERDWEKALPVFSFREEAEMFLDLGAIGRGWRVHGSCAGEVVSILCGPCAAIAEVVLDPLPEMLSERTVGLVALAREPFMETIMRRGGHPRRRSSKRGPPPGGEPVRRAG